jgi:hypothetical protein
MNEQMNELGMSGRVERGRREVEMLEVNEEGEREKANVGKKVLGTAGEGWQAEKLVGEKEHGEDGRKSALKGKDHEIRKF